MFRRMLAGFLLLTSMAFGLGSSPAQAQDVPSPPQAADKEAPQFNKAAMTVVSSMKFRPAEYDGEPVGVWMLQKVDFNTR